MASRPPTLIGGVAGVDVAEGSVSLAAILRFITFFGIATRNGIMMVNHIRYPVQEEGLRIGWRLSFRGPANAWCPS